jgi:hypothetical protein
MPVSYKLRIYLPESGECYVHGPRGILSRPERLQDVHDVEHVGQLDLYLPDLLEKPSSATPRDA